MTLYRIKYVDNLLSGDPVELGFDFAPSFDAAMGKVEAAMPAILEKHGPDAGYMIEDNTGRRVFMGTGIDD